MNDDMDLTPGFFHHLLLKIGGPFGLRWLPWSKVAFVLHDESFHHLQGGPGFFWLVPGVQRISFTVNLWPDSFQCIIDPVHSSDGLKLRLDLDIGYRFDPRKLPTIGDQARIAAMYRDPTERRREIVAQAQRVLQVIVSEFTGDEIIRNTLWEALESRLFDALGKRIGAFGMALMLEKCKLLNINAPDTLNQRLETAAQRTVNINNLAQFDPHDFSSALRSEAIETLKDMSGGNPYLNLNDLADSSGSKDNPPTPSSRILPGNSTPHDPKPSRV